jgi:hypothetical protein
MGKYTNLTDAQKEVMKTLTAIGREAGIKVFNKIIVESPVDTGQFRANWQATLNSPSTSVVIGASAGIPETSVTFDKWDLNQVVYLTNNLPYAEPLEFGWSQQRPNGWVRQAVLEGQSALDAAITKASVL